MPNEIMSIDAQLLASVNGGKQGDSLLRDINNLASQIKDATKATSGLNSTQTLLLVAMLAQRNHFGGGNSNVVYVRSGRWW